MSGKTLKVGQEWEARNGRKWSVIKVNQNEYKYEGYDRVYRFICQDDKGHSYNFTEDGKFLIHGEAEDDLVTLLKDVEDEVETKDTDVMSITKAMEVLCEYYGDIYIVYLNDALYPQNNREKLTRSIEKFFDENKQKIQELAAQEVKKVLDGITASPVDHVFHHMLDCAMGKNTNVMSR